MTWAQAARAAGDAYADDTLNRFRIERAALLRATGVEPNATLCSAVDGPARVTDFGGAAGLAGEALVRRFPNVRYTVVETPEMAALARARFPDMPVTFAETMPPECDVFFSSGTLQCIANPYDVLDAGFRSARHAVVLVRNSFSRRLLFRVHRSRLFENGGGPVPAGFDDRTVSCPNRTLSERRVHAIAAKHGFRLAESADDNTGRVAYGSLVYGRNLVFKREPLQSKSSSAPP